ncbi:MAG TPA: hypothetical protein VG368_02965, partial [Acidimicrobiales bacterium]|nr:hypothetical protein [Acidimicrobiales bacterium]
MALPDTDGHLRGVSVPRRRVAIGVGIAGALAYSSWPLGYVLNGATARSAFASDLELSGQPYNWLFIGLDCVTGIAA